MSAVFEFTRVPCGSDFMFFALVLFQVCLGLRLVCAVADTARIPYNSYIVHVLLMPPHIHFCLTLVLAPHLITNVKTQEIFSFSRAHCFRNGRTCSHHHGTISVVASFSPFWIGGPPRRNCACAQEKRFRHAFTGACCSRVQQSPPQTWEFRCVKFCRAKSWLRDFSRQELYDVLGQRQSESRTIDRKSWEINVRIEGETPINISGLV